MVLTGGGEAAELWCPRTGIGMALSTTLPGMQVYSAGGAVYGQRHAVCLGQFFPDAVHHENFASPILRAGAGIPSDHLLPVLYQGIRSAPGRKSGGFFMGLPW
ncbi:MAG: hypothetical protein V8R55_04225 [Dysosmobacter sp.]